MSAHNPQSSTRRAADEQNPDQLDALPESTGASGGAPATQRAESSRSGEYNGSTQADPREDKPGVFSPQDDTPALLKKTKETTFVRSSGDKT